MRISTRILSVLGFLSALFLTVIIISIFSITKISSNSSDLYNVSTLSAVYLMETDIESYKVNLSITQLLLNRNNHSTEEERQLIESINTKTLEISNKFKNFQETMDENDAIEAQSSEFMLLYSNWRQNVLRILSLYNSDRIDAAILTYEESFTGVFNPLRETLDELTTMVLDQGESQYVRINDVLKQMRFIYLFSVIMGLLLIFLAINIIIRKVTRPIKKISLQVQDLSEGSGDLSKRLIFESKDEMGILAKHINLFIQKTEKIIIHLQSVMVDTTTIKDGVIFSIEENSSATTQIAQNIQSISQQITSLDGNLTTITDVTLQMENLVKEYDKDVEDEVSMVEESTAAITEMIASIQNLSQIASNRKKATDDLQTVVNDGDERVRISEESVQAINGDIGSILEMTQVIDGIASQTNLLAMNAAIEAAHAGDAGKGFAVVADEIRKLAETSSEQSKQINQILQHVVGNIREASEASSFTSSTYKDLMREFNVLSSAFQEIAASTIELDTGGKQILVALDNLQAQSSSVKDNAGQMRDSNEEINRKMQDIKDISSMVNQAISEINLGMKDVANSMGKVKDHSDRLDTTVASANSQISQFKVSKDHNSES